MDGIGALHQQIEALPARAVLYTPTGIMQVVSREEVLALLAAMPASPPQEKEEPTMDTRVAPSVPCVVGQDLPQSGHEVQSRLFRKKPVVIEAAQWFKNGDHPLDYADSVQGMIDGVQREISGDYRRERGWEGSIVRYFRRPDVSGDHRCMYCDQRMHDHGWIDTREDGHVVCPGDWIITGVAGERYPCKPAIFAATYEPAALPALPHDAQARK